MQKHVQLTRGRAHHPLQYTEAGIEISTSEKELFFTLSLQTLSYDTIAQASSSLRGFRWHSRNQVRWLALVHVLSELRERTLGSDVEKAWYEVEQIYQNHPEIRQSRSKKLFRALNSLVLSAWKAREAAYRSRYGTRLETPSFVQDLRSRRKPRQPRADAPSSEDSLQQASGDLSDPDLSQPDFATMTDGHAGNEALPMPDDPTLFNPIDWSEVGTNPQRLPYFANLIISGTS